MHSIRPIKSWHDFNQIRRIHNDQKQATPHRPKRISFVTHYLLWLKWRYRRVPLLVYVGNGGSSYGLISYYDHGGNPWVEVGVLKRFKGTLWEREMWEMMTQQARPRPAYTCVRSDDRFVVNLLRELKWDGGWYTDGDGAHTQTFVRKDG